MSTAPVSTLVEMPSVDIPTGDENLLRELLNTFAQKRRRNLIRSVYYDTKNSLKDFGISIPPAMSRIEAALGWVGKGVRALTDRSLFEAFVAPAGEDDPFALEQILDENNFMVEFPQAQLSSAVHACSFMTVTRGDVQSGEPAVLMLPRAADASAAVWDSRRRRIRGFLAVSNVDQEARPTEMVMLTPERTYTFMKRQGGWATIVQPNPLGEVSVAPLVIDPELNRPFGHSRISRAAMAHVDSALRTIVRSEVSSEFYSSVEYWLFGADVSSFVGSDKWSAVMGRLKALDIPDGDDKPDLHRFNGASPQPHIEQLRMHATLFAGEMGLALSSLGIVQDNPSSADAIYAAKEDLIMTARNANRTWGQGAVKAAQLAVRLRDGLDAVDGDLRRLSAQFTDPAIASPQARADAFSKLASNIPGFAETQVGMEYAGLSREQILRLQADLRRQRVGTLAGGLREQAAAAQQDPRVAALAGARTDEPAEQVTPPGEDPVAMKAKFDALGVGIRAGVDPADAATRVGLSGIKFTGAVPVSLRQPEAEASSLEDR